jgi:uncharacterized SAM-binding protein YcdF (DUF218 family)
VRALPLSPPVPFTRRDALRFSAVAVGLFILLNLAGELLRPPFDTLGDWISLPHAPHLRHALAALVAAALLASSLLRARPSRLARATALLFAATAALALADAAAFYLALARGTIRTPALLPASIFVAAFFAALAIDQRGPAPSRAPLGARGALVMAATLLALPLLRMATFGPTRYERPADCAVVFGARVWNDGTPSDALSDRVDEAVRLYQRGLVGRVVMSGGVEPENGLSEAEVMRARAEAKGVPPEAILVDEDGVTTAATVRNAARRMRSEGMQSALVVSHYYHEPRARMLFDRAGVRAYTVPARMSRRLYKEPWFVAREVGAYWRAFAVD